MAENKMIKNRIGDIEDEIFEMKSMKSINTPSRDSENYQEKEVKVLNKNLKDRL